MSTHFEELDRLERGVSTSAANDEGSSPTTQRSRMSSTTVILDDDIPIEQASGIRGLARVKDYDARLNFYPAFSIERNMVLDYQAQQIVSLSRKIYNAGRKHKNAGVACPRIPPLSSRARHWRTKNKGQPPWAIRQHIKPRQKAGSVMMSSRGSDVKTLAGLMGILGKKLAEFDTNLTNARLIATSERPQRSALAEMKLWLSQRSKSQLQLYSSTDPDTFRIVGPRTGPMEKLVKAIIPMTRLGAILLTPFRSRSPRTADLSFDRYEDSVLSWIVGALLLLGICIFLVLPLALLSYYNTNHVASTALALGMCLLASLLARAIETDEARQIVLVCAYAAVIISFLTQVCS